MIPHRDDPSPPTPGLLEREAVRKRAGALRRRRRIVVAGPCLVVCLVALGAVFLMNDSEPSTTVTAGGGAEEATTVPPTEAAAPSETTTSVSSSSSSTEPLRAVFNLSQPLPSGWFELADPGYPLLEGRAALTVSTVGKPVEPHPTCDYPLGAMAALGPNDALISIVETPQEHSQNSRPPSSDWMPPNDPRNMDQICPQAAGEPPLSLRFTSGGFVEDGRRYRFVVAIGTAAGPNMNSEVQNIIESIEIG